MKRSIISFILTAAVIALFFLSCSQKGSSVTEESIVGDWYIIKGDVESISFIKDDTSKTFTSYLHDRPFMFGKWEIKNNKLIRTMDNGTSTSCNLLLVSDTLTLNNGTEIYTRTIPLEVQHPEVRILKNL
jgi:hypothetical protein